MSPTFRTTAWSTPKPRVRQPLSDVPGRPAAQHGAAISPFNAFLPARHPKPWRFGWTASAITASPSPAFSKPRKKSAGSITPDCRTTSDHGLAQKYMAGKASGILISASRVAAMAAGRFQDALQPVTRLVNIGDCQSPSPATRRRFDHRQLSPEELAKAGVSEDMIRLSVGIEHIDDILADLDQALQQA